jgi:L-malate glycosyltransferase
MDKNSINFHILHIISGDTWGGAEAQVLTQLKTLKEKQIGTSALLFNDRETAKKYKDAGINCHVIDEQQNFIIFFIRCLLISRCIQPSVIFSHGYKESYLAFLCRLFFKTKWIAFFHGAQETFSGFSGFKMSIYQKLQRLAVKFLANHAIAVSMELEKKLRLSSLTRSSVVYNVAPKKEIRDNSQALLLKKPAISVVGRLTKIKRIDRALAVFEQYFLLARTKSNLLPNLYIIGEGPLRASLEKQKDSLSSKEYIHFLGFQDNAVALIAQSQALLLTSDHEGLPTVILEALSSGIKVVASDVGGISEIAEVAKYSLLLADITRINSFVEKLVMTEETESIYPNNEDLRQFLPEYAVEKILGIIEKI